MAYDLYLGKMRMPVTPQRIQTAVSNQNQTISLINDGELNLLRSPGLTEIRFTLLIPQVSYPFARYGGGGFVGADAYLAYFEQLKAAKAPFQFILSRCMPTGKLLFDTSMTVALEDYTVTEDAKSGFDLEVEVRLKQYRYFAAKTISVEIPSPTAPIIVTENRPIVVNPSVSGGASGGSSSGSSGGGSSGSASGGAQVSKAYKVQVIGMDVVTVQASSPEEAILKAVGTSWKGTVYVDGLAYSGETRQRITSSSSASSASSSSSSGLKGTSTSASGSKTSTKTVSQVASKVASVVNKVTSATGKTTTTVSKKTTSAANAVKSVVKSSGGTKFAVAAKN